MTLRELAKCLPFYHKIILYVGIKDCSVCKEVARCTASKLRDKYSEDFDEYEVNRIEAAGDSSLNIYTTHIDTLAETEAYSPEETEDINKITGLGKSIIEHAKDIVKELRDYPTRTECDISMDMNLTNKGYIPTLTLTRSWIPEAIVNR